MQCFGHSGFAAITVHDQRKGERVLLYTTDETVELGPLRAYIQQLQFSPLLVPGAIRHAKALPLLGSGKTDYVSLKQWAERGGETA